MNWDSAMEFTGYSGFLHYLQLASHELDMIGITVTKNEITNAYAVPSEFLFIILQLNLLPFVLAMETGQGRGYTKEPFQSFLKTLVSLFHE